MNILPNLLFLLLRPENFENQIFYWFIIFFKHRNIDDKVGVYNAKQYESIQSTNEINSTASYTYFAKYAFVRDLVISHGII